MREIGKVASARDGARLADYLLTKGIRTRVEENAGAATIWVYEEDQRETARQELDAFNRDPADPRYDAAADRAKSIAREAAALDKRYSKNVIEVRERWAAGRLGSRPVTALLLAMSLTVAVTSNFGQDAPTDSVLRELWITPIAARGDALVSEGLEPTLRGQWWRLVTPIFIHFGILHLVFNMFLLVDLGTLVELRRGSSRMLLLVLALAISSNLAQFYWKHNPLFGGMSGVGYGLFGYVWMKSRYDPLAGFFLHPSTVFIMIVWFVLCLLNRVGGVANAAHTAGLLLGIAIGLAPIVVRRLRF
ncbi:MAG: rhomboid family intramembrane serine protease [Planctomycetia bacterium]|nr:rhomboid family intramembrane serine protease [Planctomycetia bacterium]